MHWHLLLVDMRNSFNLLLVALACFDNVYLLGGVLEAVHRSFGVESEAHVVLFPYLLYPVHAIGMTGSVLLTVAIALERFVSKEHPFMTSAQGGGVEKSLILRTYILRKIA